MPGRCRINNDNLVIRLIDNLCKSTEYSDFLRARRPQIFFHIGNIVFRHGFPCFGKHFLLIFCKLSLFIDMTHGNPAGLINYEFEMGGRIGRCQMNLPASCRKSQCNRGCDRRLSDSAFAHGEDYFFIAVVQVVYNVFELRNCLGV